MILPAIAVMGQEAASQPAQPQEKTYPVASGTKVLLSMVNSVSTKNAAPGDTLYLETSFPVFVNGRLVIPQGSYVMGTITASVRPGKIKGKGEFFLRFDSLTFPNGVTRDFHATLSNMDGAAAGTLDRAESGVKSDGNVGGDMKTIGIGAATGAGIGGLATMGRTPMGVPIGGMAGAAAGLAAVLLTRGPDAMLMKGTSVEMVLDRQLLYTESELDPYKTSPEARGAGGQPRNENRPVLERR